PPSSTSEWERTVHFRDEPDWRSVATVETVRFRLHPGLLCQRISGEIPGDAQALTRVTGLFSLVRCSDGRGNQYEPGQYRNPMPIKPEEKERYPCEEVADVLTRTLALLRGA